MKPLPSIRQLHYLVMLSEHLNFTRAAEACFVTQSTLSAGVRELEALLGVKLVERDRQTVLMTPVGDDITQRARHILAATQDLVESAAQMLTPMSGQLRLGIIPTIAPFLLPNALSRLRERYPQLRLALREDLSANLLARLEDGQLDFALIALPYATGSLQVMPLFDDGFCVVARQGDPEVASETLSATPALTRRLLLLEEGHCLRDHVLHACGKGASPSPGGMEATSLLTLLQMVESGLGIALVPEMAIYSGLAARPGLLTRPLAPPVPTRTIALVARRSCPRQEEMQALGAVFRTVGQAIALAYTPPSVTPLG